MKEIKVPLSIPAGSRSEYLLNYQRLTGNSGRLLLIAGDQKVEHLNDDFCGRGIAKEDADPEHLFKIAAASQGGVLATHLGLIARYGQDYRQLPYIIKVNGKTNLGKEEKDSSLLWWSIEEILKFRKQSGLKIAGIGYTLYLGGRYEARMLKEAARVIFEAHQAGLLAILWVYPRGNGIKEEDIHTIAGAAGVAASLDADFAKVKYPYAGKDRKAIAEKFQEVTKAAGRTKIICVGGGKRAISEIFDDLEKQITIAGSAGLAIGRNLHQRQLDEATRLARALSGMILHSRSAKEAKQLYNQKIKTTKSRGRFLGIF